MKQVLKEVMRTFDCLILIAAVFLFASFDYDNLTTVDTIYIVTFALWFALLVFRIMIMYNGRGGKTL